jgi:hypothetical protein
MMGKARAGSGAASIFFLTKHEPRKHTVVPAVHAFGIILGELSLHELILIVYLHSNYNCTLPTLIVQLLVQ